MSTDPIAIAGESADELPDELHRLVALYGSGLLDDGPGETLDAVAALAKTLLACPVGMLTLVDRDLLRVRASTAGAAPPIARAAAPCHYAIAEPDGLVVADLAADPRFAGGPLVDAGLRFYAGMPVHAPDAAGDPRAIGALCLVDTVPRQFGERERAALHQLAIMADVLIAARADTGRAVAIAVEHKRLVAELARQQRVFAQAERMTGVGSWRLSLDDERLVWSEGVFRIYGLPPGDPPALSAALAPYPPEARGRVSARLAHAIEHCEPFDFEEDFRPARGELRRVRCLGECERIDGRKVALVGVFQDVTDRHASETALRHAADTDALTGLANRAAFDKALAAAMARARAARTPLTLALIDLDGFKAINDTLGHAAGDDVLRTVGATLRGLPIATASVARIGGDEFALLVEGDAMAGLADLLDDALRFSARGGGLTLACAGSVGLARLGDEASARDFVHRADLALYAAKRARVGERRAGERRRAA